MHMYCELVKKKFELVTRVNTRNPTVPERIYNSHYGNGVPAMFTS